MTLVASGAISLSDIRTEFGGGSGAISLSDLYRGGSRVRSKAANNTSTNLAASVPTSGAIGFSSFYSQAKGFRKTFSSGATNQNCSTIFGDDYGVDYPKEIVINSGVELGATSTSDEALQANSGLAGSLSITNNGTITGAGGSANGGAGGDAFEADVACTFVNNGTIRAGGGGGGQGGTGGTGGTGGQGRTSSTSYGPCTNAFGTSCASPSVNCPSGYAVCAWETCAMDEETQWGCTQVIVNYTYYSGGSGGAGGAGGAGGVGAGYNQSSASGSGGSSGSGGAGGGTNAGSGGTGGTGGTGGAGGGFGTDGSTGSTGATGNSGGNGNYTNGSGGSGGASGSGGGAKGNYIRGLSNVTFTNNGTVQGGTA